MNWYWMTRSQLENSFGSRLKVFLLSSGHERVTHGGLTGESPIKLFRRNFSTRLIHRCNRIWMTWVGEGGWITIHCRNCNLMAIHAYFRAYLAISSDNTFMHIYLLFWIFFYTSVYTKICNKSCWNFLVTPYHYFTLIEEVVSTSGFCQLPLFMKIYLCIVNGIYLPVY